MISEHFGGWNPHRDVKMPAVAGLDLLPSVFRDSQLFHMRGNFASQASRHLDSSWCAVVIYMIVFVFVGQAADTPGGGHTGSVLDYTCVAASATNLIMHLRMENCYLPDVQCAGARKSADNIL